MGRDSSVGIATDYGLDGPGIESRWRRDFPHLSKLALGGPKLASYTIVDHPPHLAPRLKKEQTYTSTPPISRTACTEPQCLYKRILEWKPIGTRIRGRPRKRWIADIEEDMQIMGVRRWRKQCEETAEWKRITEKAKTHSGLLRQ